MGYKRRVIVLVRCTVPLFGDPLQIRPLRHSSSCFVVSNEDLESDISSSACNLSLLIGALPNSDRIIRLLVSICVLLICLWHIKGSFALPHLIRKIRWADSGHFLGRSHHQVFPLPTTLVHDVCTTVSSHECFTTLVPWKHHPWCLL